MGFGGLGGCYKCMKYTLAAFNILVLLIGGAVLGLGIYILVADNGVSDIAGIVDTDLGEVGAYLLIATGSVTIVISFLGCCGAIMESRCMLGTYFAVMLILTIIFIAIAVVGFIFKDEISDTLKKEAEDILIEKYGVDQDVTDKWDQLQQDLKCCGVTGDVSSETSWAIYKLRTTWFSSQSTALGTQYVPTSCCDPNSNQEECVGRMNGDGKIPKEGPPLSATVLTNELLYTDGCFDELEGFLEDNALIILGVAIAALVIMLMGTIFSICLCVQIGKEGYVV